MTNKNYVLMGAGFAFFAVFALVIIRMIVGFEVKTMDQVTLDKMKEQFYDFKQYRPGENPLPSVGFYDPRNHKINTEMFRGKYLILNMWATWCPGCVKELPSLGGLENYLKNNEYPATVIAVSLDREKTMGELAEFLVEHDIRPYALYHDTDKELARAYPVNGMPTTLLVDPGGDILYEFMGEADWLDFHVLTLLDKVMAPYKEKLKNENSP